MGFRNSRRLFPDSWLIIQDSDRAVASKQKVNLMWSFKFHSLMFGQFLDSVCQRWERSSRERRLAQVRSRRKWQSWDCRGALVQVLEPRTMLTIDLGDAPTPYPTTLAENGARHTDTGPTLGTARDSEVDGTHSANATADGADEDGVAFGTIMVGALGATATVNVAGAPSGAKLDAWIDFNGDGNWGGPGDQIASSVAVVNGVNAITFDVPSWSKDGTTFARFRLSTAGNLGPEGLAANGEVEDYAVTIIPPAASIGAFGGTNTVSTGVNSVRSVFAADMDGDGDMDMLSASFQDDKIAWYENDGSQNFTAHNVNTPDPDGAGAGQGNANGARSVFAADVDGDGDLDVLSASFYDDRIAWYENDGSQNFTAHNVNSPDLDGVHWNGSNGNADGAWSVTAADVDGDGDMDVLSASDIDDRIAWYENDGSQNFTAHNVNIPDLDGIDWKPPDGNADGARGVTAADVDGDGDMDILSASENDGKIAWYENDGGQNFRGHTISTAAYGASHVATADLDGDGDLDVLSSSHQKIVTWYENNGSQAFTEHAISTTAGFSSVFVVADMDGDGDLDVLSASQAWYENDGGQNFTPHMIPTGRPGVFAADMDGDGDLDVLGPSDQVMAWYENLDPELVVTTTADVVNASDGLTSLREAINFSNSHVGLDTIRFYIAGTGVQTISVTSQLPDITDAVIIDGTTQGVSATPLIELNGTSAGAGVAGLTIRAGGSTVKGLAINRFSGAGISLVNGNGNTIVGNFIGTNAAGTADLGNAGDGVQIINSANNMIGGTAAGARNLISGNDRFGISIQGVPATGNNVRGNLIGTNLAGTGDLGNTLSGVLILSASNTIGGTAAGTRNIISGNDQRGVFIASAFATSNLVQGNYIGTDITGTADLGNSLSGVQIDGGASSNTIGGLTAAARNIISGNNEYGVRLQGFGTTMNKVQGNYVGTNVSGTAAIGNSLSGAQVNATSNTVGGTTAGAGNLISGNVQHGLLIQGGVNVANQVQGNRIGTDVNGTADLGNLLSGIQVLNSSGNTIGGTTATARNVISGNNENGIHLLGSSTTTNTVHGNYIGTTLSGTADLGNSLSGVQIDGGASSNTIGGVTAAARNIISGNNEYGVRLQGFGTTMNNSVQGNYIGLNAVGQAAIGNSLSGVQVNATSNTIGGAVAGAGNVISGNGQHGVLIQGGINAANLVQGNLIGTSSNGAVDRGNLLSGIEVLNSSGNTIGGTTAAARNVIAGNEGNGIHLLGSAATTIQGNYIGTSLSGAADLGNTLNGILVVTANNAIGGSVAGAGNLISGNEQMGIAIQGVAATGNNVQGNLVGTNATGTGTIGNTLSGILLDDAGTNTIGGTTAAARNVIAGNLQDGVFLLKAGATNNLVQGNFIGTTLNGAADLGNKKSGVHIDGGASANTIGGASTAARNVISGNDEHGVYLVGSGVTGNLVQGNYIGTAVNGTAAVGNTLSGVKVANVSSNSIGGTTAEAGNSIGFNGQAGVRVAGLGTGNLILGNSMFTNTGLGIDLNGDGFTDNDTDDADSGANKFQNFPVIASAILSGSDLTITYSVPSLAPNSTFPLRVEFFIADPADQEGATLLAAVNYAAPGSTVETFPALGTVLGSKIVATATDADGNTSEFSLFVTVA